MTSRPVDCVIGFLFLLAACTPSSPEEKLTFFADKMEARFSDSDYEGAMDAALELQKVMDASFPGNDSLHLQYSGLLELVYEEMGRGDLLLPLYLKDLESLKGLGLQESPGYQGAQVSLAMLYEETGKPEKAEPVFKEVLPAIEKRRGKANTVYANALKFSASVYYRLGQTEKALHILNEVSELEREIYQGGNGNNLPLAVTANNRAMMYYQLDSLELSQHYFEKALAIIKATFGMDYSMAASITNNLGLLFLKKGDLPQAKTRLEQSLEIRKNVHGVSHPGYLRTLNNLIRLQRKSGELEKAEKEMTLLKELLNSSKLNASHPIQKEVLLEEALLLQAGGDGAGALRNFKSLLDLVYTGLEKVFPSLSEKEKAAFVVQVEDYLNPFREFALEAGQRHPEILEVLFNSQLQTKGMLFSYSQRIHQLANATSDTTVKNLYQKWVNQKELLNKAFRLSEEERKKARLSISELESSSNELEKQLSQVSAEFAKAIISRRYGWKEVKSALSEGEIAMEVLRLENAEREVKYAFLAITPESPAPEMVVLYNGKELEEKSLKRYQTSIQFKLEDELSYASFWEPLKGLSAFKKPIQKIYFSPDGLYNQISLNTLRNPSTGKFLLEEVEIQLIGSSRDLLETHKEEREIKNATLIGFPDYDAGTEADSPKDSEETPGEMQQQRFFSKGSIADLPGTKEEVNQIGKLLNDKGISVQQFLETDATETVVKEMVDQQVIHIATHGFFLSDPTSNSRQEDRGFNGMGTALVENPLLRSGILLAGSEQAVNGKAVEGEDGILTAFEAINLSLQPTQLVVLSACETGLGEVKNGEGVYGLQRSLQVAGAKQVLNSLWKVDDQATRKLMTLFYGNLMEGNPISLAFRNAQLELKKSYPEPYYWGAFVLVGKE